MYINNQRTKIYGNDFPNFKNANPVLYADTERFIKVLPGPPFVNANIIENSCIEAINLKINAIYKNGFNIGNVKVLKVNHAEPPSIFDDSKGDFGSDCTPAK